MNTIQYRWSKQEGLSLIGNSLIWVRLVTFRIALTSLPIHSLCAAIDFSAS